MCYVRFEKICLTQIERCSRGTCRAPEADRQHYLFWSTLDTTFTYSLNLINWLISPRASHAFALSLTFHFTSSDANLSLEQRWLKLSLHVFCFYYVYTLLETPPPLFLLWSIIIYGLWNVQRSLSSKRYMRNVRSILFYFRPTINSKIASKWRVSLLIDHRLLLMASGNRIVIFHIAIICTQAE